MMVEEKPFEIKFPDVECEISPDVMGWDKVFSFSFLFFFLFSFLFFFFFFFFSFSFPFFRDNDITTGEQNRAKINPLNKWAKC